MNDALDSLLTAVRGLQLHDIPVDEYDDWVYSPPIRGDITTSEDDPDEENLSFVLGNVKAVTEHLKAWMYHYSQLEDLELDTDDEDGRSKSSLAQSQLWERLSMTCDRWNRALNMLVNKTLIKFLQCTIPASEIPFSGAFKDACLYIDMYWSFLCLPGASAFGLFDAAVMRRSLTVLKEYMQLCAVSIPKASSSAIDISSVKSRNVRTKGNAQTKRTGKGRSRSSARKSGTEISGEFDDGNATEADIVEVGVYESSIINRMLSQLEVLLRHFTFQSHQEFIPIIADLLVEILVQPGHIVPLALPTQFETSLPLEREGHTHYLITAAYVLLGLFYPHHASPLTAARIVLKRLHEPYLQGSIKSNKRAASSTAADAIGEDGVSRRVATLQNLGPPQCPPDPRIVRARTLYLIRCLLTDSVAGRSVVQLQCSPDSAIHPIPVHVLARYPAMAALLQHLCIRASNGKVDIRNIATDGISHLRACLPHSLRRSYVRFLHKLSTSERVSYRQMAVEICGKLLGLGVITSAATSAESALESSGTSETAEITENNKNLTHQALSRSAPSLVVAQVIEETAIPTDIDLTIEQAGYGTEGAEYAGVVVDMDTTVNTLDTTFRATARLSTAGASHTTPQKQQQRAEPIDPDASALNGISSDQPLGNLGSPFYGRRSNVVNPNMMKGVTQPNSNSSSFPIAGCEDPRPTVLILLTILFHRASDRNPSVRAKAISLLSSALDPQETPLHSFYSILLTHIAHTHNMSFADSIEGTPSSSTMAFESRYSESGILTPGKSRLITANVHEIKAYEPAGPSPLVPLFLRRLLDSRANVKRAAVHALAALGASGGVPILYSPILEKVHLLTAPTKGSDIFQSESEEVSWEVLLQLYQSVVDYARYWSLETGAIVPASQTLGAFALRSLVSVASDPSVLMRRAAIQVLHKLLLQELHVPALRQLWLITILPLVSDVESTVVTSAVQCVREILLDGIITWHEKSKNMKLHPTEISSTSLDFATIFTPWELLSTIAQSSDLTQCLTRCIIQIAQGIGAGSKFQSFPLRHLLLVLHSALGFSDRLMDVVAKISNEQLESPGETQQFAVCARHVMTNIKRGTWLLLGILTTHCKIPQTVVQSKNNGATESKTTTPILWGKESPFFATCPQLIANWTALEQQVCRDLEKFDQETASQYSPYNRTSALPFLSFPTALTQSISDAERILFVLSTIPEALDANQSYNALMTHISNGLVSLAWPACIISSAVDVCKAMIATHTEPIADIAKQLQVWANPILASIEQTLSSLIANPFVGDSTGSIYRKIVAAIHTLGQLAIIGLDADEGQGVSDKLSNKDTVRSLAPITIPNRLVMLVQLLIAPTLAPTSSQKVRQEVKSLMNPGEVETSQQVDPDSGFDKDETPSEMQKLSSVSTSIPLPDAIRTYAYASLGKLCLRDTALAQRVLPIFVRDLSPDCPHPVPVGARNNILLTLGDLCVRYTSFVDRHSHALAAAFMDPSPMIRKNALALVTQLTSSDYLKWKGHVFYRFAVCLADSDPDVHALAESILANVLAPNNKTLLLARFIDLIFVFTASTSHPAYLHLVGGRDEQDMDLTFATQNKKIKEGILGEQDQALVSSVSGTTGISKENISDTLESENGQAQDNDNSGFAGLENNSIASLAVKCPKKRMLIYSKLLAHMTDEQIFTLQGRLALDVLGAVVEGTLSLTPFETLKQLYLTSKMTRSPMFSSPVNRPERSTSRDNTDSPSLDVLHFPEGSTEALVAEVISLLSSPIMRPVERQRVGETVANAAEDAGDEADPEEGNVSVAASLSQAKQRMLAKLARKQALENLLPICLGLKALVTDSRNPLLGPIVGYLYTLVQDYGDDVKGLSHLSNSFFNSIFLLTNMPKVKTFPKPIFPPFVEILTADRQAAAELEFDLRLYASGAFNKNPFVSQQSHAAKPPLSSPTHRTMLSPNSLSTYVPFASPITKGKNNIATPASRHKLRNNLLASLRKGHNQPIIAGESFGNNLAIQPTPVARRNLFPQTPLNLTVALPQQTPMSNRSNLDATRDKIPSSPVPNTPKLKGTPSVVAQYNSVVKPPRSLQFAPLSQPRPQLMSPSQSFRVQSPGLQSPFSPPSIVQIEAASEAPDYVLSPRITNIQKVTVQINEQSGFSANKHPTRRGKADTISNLKSPKVSIGSDAVDTDTTDGNGGDNSATLYVNLPSDIVAPTLENVIPNNALSKYKVARNPRGKRSALASIQAPANTNVVDPVDDVGAIEPTDVSIARPTRKRLNRK